MAIILRTKHILGLWNENSLWGQAPEKAPYVLREHQRLYLAKNPAAVAPFEVDAPINAYIGGGAWRVLCRCNEAPHTDPDWKLACCFGCGAIYTNVIFPSNYQDIENLLTKRPVQMHRNWKLPETYDELVAEQIAEGDPV